MLSIKNAQYIKGIANCFNKSIIKRIRKIIFNNTDNMIITPGHYCAKSTFNNEAKTVVRVYGYDDNQGMYKTDSGYLTESDLMNNYIKMDTRMNDRKPIVIGKKLKIGDLSKLNNTESEEEIQPQPIQKLDIKPRPEFQPQLEKQQPPQISESELIIKSLIKRSFIDSDKKAGSKKLSPLKIEFTIDYDLNTIKNGVDFLNINVDEFCRYFVNTIKFTEHLESSIKSRIINDDISTDIETSVNNNPVPNPVDELLKKYLQELNQKYTDDKEPEES